MARRQPVKARPRSWRARLGRLIIRLARGVLVAALLAVTWSAGFIGLKCYGGAAAAPDRLDPVAREIPGYGRDEVSTYLTLPEWYIVYNTDEYAKALGTRAPSGFPYIGSVRQYWRYYGAACRATKGVYPFSAGNHLMLAVIGSSFSIEYILKGLYENTAGRITEWVGGHDTPEDAFARRTAAEYGAFMHTVPWYEFPFAARLAMLWRETPAGGPHLVRKWERRIALTGEYGAKAAYGWLIGLGSNAAYGPEQLRIHARIENASAAVYADGAVKRVRDGGGGTTIVTLPRYEAFTAQMLAVLAAGGRFADIAGNDEILVTVLTRPGWTARELQASVVLDERTLTDPTVVRVGLRVPVTALHLVVPQIVARGGRIEHFYDY